MVTISSEEFTQRSEGMVFKRRAGAAEHGLNDSASSLHFEMLEETKPLHKGGDFLEFDESSEIDLHPIRHRMYSEDSLPSWMPSNPLADDASFARTLVFTARRRKSTLSMAVMAFCFLGCLLYSSAHSTLKTCLMEVHELVAFSDRLHTQVRTAERDVHKLERELAALDAMEHQKEDIEEEKRILNQAAAEFANPQLMREMNAIQRKLKYQTHRAAELKEKVSHLSHRDAVGKYGAGTKRVEIELIFPGETEGPTTFIVEMAPLEIMPHSVFTFLEMVSSDLLNGCSFILNALHVVKAAPLPYDGSAATDKARDFLDHGLESVAFREYSPEYPHRRYTLGFAADGSPSFYINTEDNTEIHVGDPCFAKIVSGFDTIERLESRPTRNGIWFEQRIGIIRATVL